MGKEASTNNHLDFILKVLNNSQALAVNWEQVAKDDGQAYARNARAKLDQIAQKYGYRFQNNLVTKDDENGDHTAPRTPAKTPTRATRTTTVAEGRSASKLLNAQMSTSKPSSFSRNSQKNNANSGLSSEAGTNSAGNIKKEDDASTTIPSSLPAESNAEPGLDSNDGSETETESAETTKKNHGKKRATLEDAYFLTGPCKRVRVEGMPRANISDPCLFESPNYLRNDIVGDASKIANGVISSKPERPSSFIPLDASQDARRLFGRDNDGYEGAFDQHFRDLVNDSDEDNVI